MARQRIIDCLDRLEHIIESSAQVPFTGKRLVDRVEVLELIDQMRISLPEEIRQAESLLTARATAAAETKRESGSVEEVAQKSQSPEPEAVAQAKAEAERIVAEARRLANEIRNGADDYAEATLTSLEETLQRTARVTRKGIEELRRRKSVS